MSTLTLGISTVIDRYENAKKLIDEVAPLFDELVLVIQGAESDKEERKGNILKIFSSKKGLSISRNTLIERSSSTWLWINDDDVSIKSNYVSKVRSTIESHGTRFTMFAGRIGCIGCNKYFKKYRFRWISPLLYAQVSSVEIIINRNWCKKNFVSFDPNFGLGTEMPIAEEPIFAADVVKAGGIIKDIPDVIVDHPCNEATETSWKSWGLDKISTARGRAAARIGGSRGLLLFFAWLTIAILNTRSIKSIRSISRGYFSYE